MNGSDALVPRSARTRLSLLAVVLLGTLSLTAQAAIAGTPLNGGPAPLTGSAFQGADGNQKTPLPGDPDHVAMPARTDWQTYASSPRLSTLPDASGLQDTWFFHGKEQEPDKWTFQQRTVSPGKADVLGAWSLTDPVSSNVFLYLAFFRSAAGGTSFYNFELNQLTSTWTNSQGTVIPCRKNGDIIVSFELQGNAGDVGVRVWKWQSGSPGPAACPEGKIGTWTASDALGKDAMGNTIAQGAMNTGPIANYLDFDLDRDRDPSTNPSPASFDAADTFGEAALNLSKVLSALNSGNSCFDYGQIQLHTRTAEPFTADLKDFIAPQPIVARSCAIEGTKYHDLDADGTQDAGEPGLSGFRIYADTNGSGGFDAGEPSTFSADGTQPGKPLGSWVLGNLPAGSYKIREDLTNAAGNPRATEGWTCSDPSTIDPAPASATAGCRFDVSLADGGVVGGLKFGNYKKALVRVEKQTLPDGAPGSFGFTSTLPGKAAFSLPDGGVEETLVTPGVYTASETLHPDFNLTGIACTTGGQVISPTTVQFNAASGQTITCTYTNSRKTGQLTVRKVLDPTTDTGKFDLKIGADVVVDDGGHLAQGVRTLPTGTSYTVSEAAGTGTSLSKYVSSVVCKDGEVTVASGSGPSLSDVPVLEGRNVVCTFTNRRRPGSIEVVKDLKPADDAGRFDLKVGGTVVKAAAGDGQGGSTDVAPGTYTVSEAGAGGTDLSKYDTSIACVKNGQPAQSGGGASLAGVNVDSNDVVVCTITNTRLGTIEIEKQTHPDEDDGPAFGFASSLDPQSFQLADDGVKTIANVKPNAGGTAYEVTEATKLGYRLSSVDCGQDADSAGSTATRTASIHVSPGETVRCTFTNTKLSPGALVVKKGTQKAHHGDPLTYTFDVVNTGNSPLHDVSVTDDRCAPVTRVSGDELLEPGEHWLYSCSYTAPAGHHAGEEDPIVNTVTATAKDEQDRPVSDTDTHETDLLHPDIEVDKQVDRQRAHVGDTLHYRFVVTNEGDAPLSVAFGDPRCDAGTLTGPSGDADGDGRLDVGETWVYECSHVVTEQDPNPLPNTATVKGTDELGGTDEDEDSTSVEILKPGTLVVKEGNQFAYPGDTVTFTFAVTNNGNAPLSDVTVTDDRCAPVTRSSGDALLDPGEKWIFTCSKQIPPDHEIGDENPIRNVATATGKDQLGKTVTSQDDHLVRVLHPAVDIEKAGPATAVLGSALAYTLKVTNPGDVPFARQDVVVADPRCEAPPAGPSTGGDATPGQLDPGDTWTYTCTAQTAGQPAGTFVNTATVNAKDFNGRQVGDTDQFPTMLETLQVLPQPQIVSGTARLGGPSGCVRGPFTATVRGRRIAQVTFYRDGKPIKTITAKPGQRKFTVKVRPGRSGAIHRVTARVRFRASSQTPARTLRLSYQRCRKQVVIPRFTG